VSYHDGESSAIIAGCVSYGKYQVIAGASAMKRRFTLRVAAAILLIALATLVPRSTAYALTNGLCPTPPMGWSSWNRFGCSVTETDILQMADAMATNGMKDAGYQYINIDDAWQGSRDTNGVMMANATSFPSGIKALADYIHSRGLKFGLYSSRGVYTCCGRRGSYGYENLDALTYSSWGVDYVKYDSCFPVDDAYSDFTRMGAALADCGRPVVFSISPGGFVSWAPEVGNLWRTTGDIGDSFAYMVSNLDGNNNSAFAAGPGHWNDPDMLEVGNGGMSDTEYLAHFSLWCVVAAPLIAGNDLTTMSQATRATLTNPEVIAVDQDPAGVQGTRVSIAQGVDGNLEVWCKLLGTGLTTKAVVLFNRSSTNASITVNWSDISLQPGNATVRDLWARTDLGTFVNAYSAVVPTHGAELLKIIGTGIVDPGTSAPPSASFTAAPTNGVALLTVTFVDNSTGSISNWFWSFGDGNATNATTKNMRHTYVTAGTYNVTEIVSGPGGSSTNTRANYITALPPSASFTAAPTNGVIPLTVTFADTSTGSISNWLWNFGDGNTTNAPTKNMRHTYITAGTYNVTEIVSGPGGSGSSTRANYITALPPPPSASFTAEPIDGVAPLTVTFADTSTGSISNWFWSFGDGNTTNAPTKSMSHTYITAGTYSVTEIVSGPGGSGSSTPASYITVLTPLEGLQFQAWQLQYFGCTNCQQARMSMDADGTGQNNLFKYVAGLDPTNSASVFVLNIVPVPGEAAQKNLLFSPLAADRTYTPEFSTNLALGGWAPITDYAGPVTNGNVVTITDTNAVEPQKFYRIDISLP
jgi:alpha-galactosidase